MRYIDEMMRCKCASKLIELQVFPNAKEISESFGAYNAVRTYLKSFDLKDNNITCVSVGDGHTPRTAATFAFRTGWRCISVDPALRIQKKYGKVDRLELYKDKIENVKIEADRVVVLAVHSHASIETTLESINAREIAIVAIPCCFALEVPNRETLIKYEDFSILSEKRTVKVWDNIFA